MSKVEFKFIMRSKLIVHVHKNVKRFFAIFLLILSVDHYSVVGIHNVLRSRVRNYPIKRPLGNVETTQ